MSLPEFFVNGIINSVLSYYLPKNNLFSYYGTAGFRQKAENLPHVVYRSGIFFALIGASLPKQEVLGAMLTASHNPVEENGLKLIDPSGSMLAEEWEKKITEFVNAELSLEGRKIASLQENDGKNFKKQSSGIKSFDVSFPSVLGMSEVSLDAYSCKKNFDVDRILSEDVLEKETYQKNNDEDFFNKKNNLEKLQVGGRIRVVNGEKEDGESEETNELQKKKTSQINSSNNQIVIDETLQDGDISVNSSNRELIFFFEEILNSSFGDFLRFENSREDNKKLLRLSTPWTNDKPRILVGHDTRPSSKFLVDIFCKGVNVGGGRVVFLGEVSTPQLHFLVERTNSLNLQDDSINEKLYFSFFQKHFEDFCLRLGNIENEGIHEIYFDGSNGIGAKKVEGFVDCLKKNCNITIKIFNNGTSGGILNHGCGAEFVQKQRLFPEGFAEIKSSISNDGEELPKCCSVDGDCDRIVYFTKLLTETGNSLLVLLDGDKIMALCINSLLKLLIDVLGGFNWNNKSNFPTVLSIGMVQTAYANGSSSEFLYSCQEMLRPFETLHINTSHVFVKTGIKSLAKKASSFDIGVYFEANGHGTIQVNFDSLLRWAIDRNIHKTEGYQRLISFLSIFNQTTGDGLTCLLAVEASLRYLRKSLRDWAFIYTEFPSLQATVPMRKDVMNTLVPHEEHEKFLVKPAFLQTLIDEAVMDLQSPYARAFVRPSGTEEKCRIYCEASTEKALENLSRRITLIMKNYAISFASN